MPSHADIQQHLRSAIREGRWRAGDRLPSEAELCAQFGVARMTVNRALRELQQAGLVRREQGRGSFVAELSRVAARLELRDLQADVAERGHHHDSELLALRREPADAAVAQALGLRRGAAVFFCQLLHREQGLPLQLETRWVRPSAAPDFLRQDFRALTPTAYLLQVAPLVAAQYQIEATAASADEARWLGLHDASPCLTIQRLSHGAGGPVSWARLVHPGGRYVLQGSFEA